MGLKLSRKIRSFRNDTLNIIKNKNTFIYKLLIFFGCFFKFVFKINKKKNYKNYSINLDEINKFEYRKTSQNNEDGIINFVLSKLSIKEVNFIEIGFDYYENNSLNLLKNTKKGLFIDGENEKVFLLKNILRILHPFKKLNVICKLINKDNINKIISENFNENDDIDFLSIDVDGIDYFLFDTIKIKPKLICIEYNFWFGKNVKCSVPYNKDFRWQMGSVYSGASLNALTSLAKLKGYYLIALDSSCVNAFFIRDDLKSNFEILNPNISFKEPIKYNYKDIDKTRKKLLEKKLIYF
tara:strand:+ start:127 stop:1014 length:888 start_codon:yes stop_codon:yes gene_type:complete